MLPVFMEIAAHRNFLFYTRCGAKDFFDKLKRLLLQPFSFLCSKYFYCTASTVSVPFSR